jgi:hypothetical protein
MIEIIAQTSSLTWWAGLGAFFTLIADIIIGVIAIVIAFT